MVETQAVNPDDTERAVLNLFAKQLAHTAELLRASPAVSPESASGRLILLADAARTLGLATSMIGPGLLCVQSSSGADVLTAVHHHDVLTAVHGCGPNPAAAVDQALCGPLATYHAAPALALLYAVKAAMAQVDAETSAALRIVFGADAEAGGRCFSGAACRSLFAEPCILVNGAFSDTGSTLPGWLDVEIKIPVREAGDSPRLQTQAGRSVQRYELHWEMAGVRSDIVPDVAVASLYPEPLCEGAVLRDIEAVITALDLPISVTPYPQRDRLGLRMVASGRSGHASDPGRADNALYHLALLCSRLPVYGQYAYQWIAKTFDARGKYRTGHSGGPGWSVGQLSNGGDCVELRCAARLSWEVDPSAILDDLRSRFLRGGSVQPRVLFRGRKERVSNRLRGLLDDALAAAVKAGQETGTAGDRGSLSRFPEHVRGVSFGPLLPGQEDHAYEGCECVREEDLFAITCRYARMFANWLEQGAL